MVDAGRALVDYYGSFSPCFIELFELVLARQLSATASSQRTIEFDRRKEAVVVFLGGAGKHLSKDDPAVLTIIDCLLDALKTPSESVQLAVSDSLVGLVQLIKGTEVASKQLEILYDRVIAGDSYGERKGAAMGLSAYVKGLGIPCLKHHNIVDKLKDVCSEGSVINRQGALFAFEALSDRLGLLFEPYVIAIMPILIKSFSHSSDHVRDAAHSAAKVHTVLSLSFSRTDTLTLTITLYHYLYLSFSFFFFHYTVYMYPFLNCVFTCVFNASIYQSIYLSIYLSVSLRSQSIHQS